MKYKANSRKLSRNILIITTIMIIITWCNQRMISIEKEAWSDAEYYYWLHNRESE